MQQSETERRVADGETFKRGNQAYTNQSVEATHKNENGSKIGQIRLDSGNTVWVYAEPNGTTTRSYTVIEYPTPAKWRKL